MTGNSHLFVCVLGHGNLFRAGRFQYAQDPARPEQGDTCKESDNPSEASVCICRMVTDAQTTKEVPMYAPAMEVGFAFLDSDKPFERHKDSSVFDSCL